MKGIYRFWQNWGRMGELHAIFVADAADVANAIGKRLYFGEVLGKHSDIYGPLEASDVTLVSDAADDVATFERLKLASGYNPLEYLDEADDEEDEKDDEA